MCGVSENDAPFNAEHVIPDWVQKFCDLRDKFIKLPNATSFSYSQYKIPCCIECNSFLGDTFETPISRAFSKGPNEVSSFFNNGGAWVIFIWLNLIYLKVHIKDNFLRFDRDERNKDQRTIGDFHPWEQLHHCHALVRAKRFGVDADPNGILGSTMSLQLGDWTKLSPFDYNDHIESQTVMLRLKNVAFICVLDDSCGTLQGLGKKLNRLPPDLNPAQFAEILTEFQFVSMHLKYRPTYKTIIDRVTGRPTIYGDIPKLFDLDELDFSLRGELMLRNLDAMFPKFAIAGKSREETIAIAKTGDLSFLGNQV